LSPLSNGGSRYTPEHRNNLASVKTAISRQLPTICDKSALHSQPGQLVQPAVQASTHSVDFSQLPQQRPSDWPDIAERKAPTTGRTKRDNLTLVAKQPIIPMSNHSP
jgi:hypothetical protein